MMACGWCLGCNDRKNTERRDNLKSANSDLSQLSPNSRHSINGADRGFSDYFVRLYFHHASETRAPQSQHQQLPLRQR